MAKCPFCKKEFNQNKVECVKEARGKVFRYYHPDCYDKMRNGEMPNQMAVERKKLSKKVENPTSDIDLLNNYCVELFGEENYDPKAVMITANKMIADSRNTYTFKGILYTLHYVYEVVGLNVAKANNNIRIVPYYYTKAQKYYEKIALAQKINENKTVKVNKNNFEIYIDKPESKRKVKKLFSFLDEDDIEEETETMFFDFK